MAVTNKAPDPNVEPPWHAAYPPPKHAEPSTISRAEVLKFFQEGKKVGKDFILVDLRRNDHEVRKHINMLKPSHG